MDELTAKHNEQSVEYIRKMIEMKTKAPYFANGNSVKNIVTDMDHHPYTRWYRGVYYYPEPIVMEREAGWRPLENSCYELTMPPIEPSEERLCFEPPCGTVFPCIAGKGFMDLTNSTKCVVSYR